MLGLLREALENGYRGPVLWLHYARHPGQRAWLGELEALAARHPNLELRWSLTRGALGRWLPGGAFPAATWTAGATDPGAQPGPGLRAGGLVEAVGEQLGARFAGDEILQRPALAQRGGAARSAPALRPVAAGSLRRQRRQPAGTGRGPRPAPGPRLPLICASCTCVLLSGCVRDLRSGALCSEPGQPIRLCVSAAHGDLALDL